MGGLIILDGFIPESGQANVCVPIFNKKLSDGFVAGASPMAFIFFLVREPGYSPNRWTDFHA